MNNPWAFLPMAESNDLLGDAAALRARMADDGYLYFRGVLDPDRLRTVRRAILTVLADQGWIKGPPVLARAQPVRAPVREGDDDFFAAYDEVQKLEAFHTFAHDEQLMAIMRAVVGDSAFPHPLKVARLSFPSHFEATTPPHQDYLNNQGTEHLTASWIPLGDVPIELGPIAILRGSHRFGVLPLEFHLGAGNRQAVLPPEMLELRWYTTDFALGDLLLFPALTVHASLHNASDFFMRISIDFRYQKEGEDLTELVLHPHFQRLTWEEIYTGWESDRYQYYWKDLDYRVVPFDRSRWEIADLRETDLRAIMKYEHRIGHRFRGVDTGSVGEAG